MGAAKYKVSQEHDGKVLVYGNFLAANAEDAIRKAYEKQSWCSPFNMDKVFHVKRGSVEMDVMLSE